LASVVHSERAVNVSSHLDVDADRGGGRTHEPAVAERHTQLAVVPQAGD
jgi:hypothetical protein